MVMEILALMLSKEKIKAYRTANRIDHLLDIYADNLTIYLVYKKMKNWYNSKNVLGVLNVINRFYNW